MGSQGSGAFPTSVKTSGELRLGSESGIIDLSRQRSAGKPSMGSSGRRCSMMRALETQFR